jgi:hypothetical protein
MQSKERFSSIKTTTWLISTIIFPFRSNEVSTATAICGAADRRQLALLYNTYQ